MTLEDFIVQMNRLGYHTISFRSPLRETHIGSPVPQYVPTGEIIYSLKQKYARCSFKHTFDHKKPVDFEVMLREAQDRVQMILG